MARIGPRAQFAPGQENVAILVRGERILSRMGFARGVGKEAQRPEKQFFPPHERFDAIQDGGAAGRIIAQPIPNGRKVDRMTRLVPWMESSWSRQ